MKIKTIIFKEEVLLPKRAHYNDAGADVFSTININIYPGTTIKIPLGFGLEIPDGYMACIYPRTSLTSHGIISHIPPIDSGYRGQIHAIITNNSTEPYFIEEGDKVGQLVVTPIILVEFVDNLENDRGIGAFGSTGK